MAHTLESFVARCRGFLSADPGPAGCQNICDLLCDALKDPAFIAATIDPNGPERHILYEDPDFGFTVLSHSYKGAKNAPPHDHGPTWAIYGQATGTTIMTDWAPIERATADKPGTSRHVRDYELTPGMAYLYNPGELHSPRRDDSTCLIRIEGINVARIKRFPYIAVADRAA